FIQLLRWARFPKIDLSGEITDIRSSLLALSSARNSRRRLQQLRPILVQLRVCLVGSGVLWFGNRLVRGWLLRLRRLLVLLRRIGDATHAVVARRSLQVY
ncbi:hypothetical protein PFISCL1PPCAC_22380, partial [Pristionchus fissidentatus]